MNREVAELWSDAIGASGIVIRYGYWGRPVLVFPSEQGKARDFENNGMVGAVAGLLDEGRLKLYCVDTVNNQSPAPGCAFSRPGGEPPRSRNDFAACRR